MFRPKFQHSRILYLKNGKFDSFEPDIFARLRHMAKQVEHKPAYCKRIRVLGKRPPCVLGKFPQKKPRQEYKRTIRLLFDFNFFFSVEFITNFSENLIKQIRHGHQAANATEFIGHDSYMGSFLP